MASSKVSNSSIEVAIIGAGIGGLGLAIGLLRQGVPYTIYESAAAYSMIGAGIGLGPNAQAAMSLLSPSLKSLYDGIATGNITTGKNNVIFDTLLATPGFGEDNGWGQSIASPSYERTSAHRKALLEVMTSLIPKETVRFSKKATLIVQHGDKVHVSFADGEIVIVDAVIGCDGSYHNASRPAVLGTRYPDFVNPVYAGRYCYRAIVPMGEARRILGEERAGDSKMFVSRGRNVLTYPISRGEELNVVAFRMDGLTAWAGGEVWQRAVEREVMLEDMEGLDERLIALLQVRWVS